MGWVSKKVFAILNGSDEGKKILENIGEKDQDTVDKEVSEFFGSSGASYNRDEDEDYQDFDVEKDIEDIEEKKYQEETSKERDRAIGDAMFEEDEADSDGESDENDNSESKTPKRTLADEWNARMRRYDDIRRAVETARKNGQSPQQVIDSVSRDLDIDLNSKDFETLKNEAMYNTRMNKNSGQYEYNKYNVGSNKLLTNSSDRQKMVDLAEAFKQAGLEDVKVVDGYEDAGAGMEWTSLVEGGSWLLDPSDWIDYMNDNISAEELVEKKKNDEYAHLHNWSKPEVSSTNDDNARKNELWKKVDSGRATRKDIDELIKLRDKMGDSFYGD